MEESSPNTTTPPSADELSGLRNRVIELESRIEQLTAIVDREHTAEEALKNERNLLRTLIDNMPDYIFFKDRESRFILNNKAHLQVLGAKSQSEVAGKSDFDMFPDYLATRYYADEQIVLQIGRHLIGREEPVKQHDGTDMWLSTTKIPVYDPEGRINGLVGISRDITERKRFEDALQKAKDELEIRVAERTADLSDANALLASRLSQLDFLTLASFRLSQFIRIDELGGEILKAFSARFPPAQAVLCLRDHNKFTLLSATESFSGELLAASALQALSAFNESELHDDRIIEDWTKDGRIGALQWPGFERYNCYLAIPLLMDNVCIAVLQVFTTGDYCAAHEAELPVLNTLAAHAAVCLSNARNYKELGDSARRQGELNAARTIQQRFSLHDNPTIPSIKLKSIYLPAYEVGGDYLDCFQTNAGNWVIVIADVCGKGMPAALFMIMLRSSFRMLGHSAGSAKELLCAVNAEMGDSLDENTFVTALCLMITKDGSSMTYARAGHPYLVCQPGIGKQAALLINKGIAMGFAPDPAKFYQAIEELTIPLKSGNRFFIYTDGLTEANDRHMNPYGIKQLVNFLTRDASSCPEVLVKKILSDIKLFSGDAPALDDLTLLAMEIE
jgi:PAS domain S-box-containing protein